MGDNGAVCQRWLTGASVTGLCKDHGDVDTEKGWNRTVGVTFALTCSLMNALARKDLVSKSVNS